MGVVLCLELLVCLLHRVWFVVVNQSDQQLFPRVKSGMILSFFVQSCCLVSTARINWWCNSGFISRVKFVPLMLFKFMLYTYGIIHCTLTVTDVQNGGRGAGEIFFFGGVRDLGLCTCCEGRFFFFFLLLYANWLCVYWYACFTVGSSATMPPVCVYICVCC